MAGIEETKDAQRRLRDLKIYYKQKLVTLEAKFKMEVEDLKEEVEEKEEEIVRLKAKVAEKEKSKVEAQERAIFWRERDEFMMKAVRFGWFNKREPEQRTSDEISFFQEGYKKPARLKPKRTKLLRVKNPMMNQMHMTNQMMKPLSKRMTK